MEPSELYKHPWIHLDPDPSPFPNFPISDATYEAIHLISQENKSQLYLHPTPLVDYIIELTIILLDTITMYSDEFCQKLPPSSPLWIAMLISNIIKKADPTLHRNEHIHPISHYI